jgi:hypothetical protein
MEYKSKTQLQEYDRLAFTVAPTCRQTANLVYKHGHNELWVGGERAAEESFRYSLVVNCTNNLSLSVAEVFVACCSV